MSRRVPIRPRVGVFSVFEAVDYKAWFALAEFVDNSIQSKRDTDPDGAGEPLRIDVRVGGSQETSIRIEDNAGGILPAQFDRAFEVGSPPPDPAGLSVYGIGMKSAAAWFARDFRLTTTCAGEPVQRTVHFNFPKIVAEGLEELDILEEPAPTEAHGTVVLLEGLKHPLHTATHSKVRDHLTSIYRNFLRSGELEMSYRGERLRYGSPEVLTAPRFRTEAPTLTWRKDIDLELSSGERVRGFAALRQTGRASGSGFSLYRQGRVITGLDDDPWRPTEIFGYGNSYRSQRLFGELHLTNVKVAYSKNGFIWQASEAELINRLREVLDEEPLPLLQQAEKHRSREPEPRQKSAAKRALGSTVDAIVDAVETDLESRVAARPPQTPPAELPESDRQLDRREIMVPFRGTTWLLTIQLSEAQDGDWLVLADTGTPVDPNGVRHVGLQININNEYMRRFGGGDAADMEAILRLGGALALAVITCREQGLRFADYLLQHVNQLLKGSLAR